MVVAEVVVVAAVGLNLVVLQPTPDKISAPWLLLVVAATLSAPASGAVEVGWCCCCCCDGRGGRGAGGRGGRGGYGGGGVVVLENVGRDCMLVMFLSSL